MKKLLLALLILPLSLLADTYTFTGVTVDPSDDDGIGTVELSSMTAKGDIEKTEYCPVEDEYRFFFTSTLSAGDITALKALFSGYTPDF